MGHLDGVPEEDVVARLADELDAGPESFTREEYETSTVRDVVLGTIRELEDEGLLTVPVKVSGPWELRPTSDGRRRVSAWREEWERRRAKQDREVQRAILRELERQWRADPERHKLRSQIDVERFCEENDIERDV
jgi:DNA-binding PadR family transcriptional regulator